MCSGRQASVIYCIFKIINLHFFFTSPTKTEVKNTNPNQCSLYGLSVKNFTHQVAVSHKWQKQDSLKLR